MAFRRAWRTFLAPSAAPERDDRDVREHKARACGSPTATNNGHNSNSDKNSSRERQRTDRKTGDAWGERSLTSSALLFLLRTHHGNELLATLARAINQHPPLLRATAIVSRVCQLPRSMQNEENTRTKHAGAPTRREDSLSPPHPPLFSSSSETVRLRSDRTGCYLT